MRQEAIYITWLNNKGGFEYFFFNQKNVYIVSVEETGSTRNNILPRWPMSYGITADTINRQTHRVTRNQITLKSQHLNRNQVETLVGISTSPLVQIVSIRTNRRTVIVSADSFKKVDVTEKLSTLQFNISYTDEIPSQRI